MKKKSLMPVAKSAFALSLAATMIVPSGIPAIAADDSSADTEVTVPAPIRTIDFNKGLLGVLNDENASKDFTEWRSMDQLVGKSEEIYFQKTAEEVGGTEKVDANGLVYTGDSSNAHYHKSSISNQPTTAWDDEKGSVLKIGKTQTIPAVYKSKPAGTDDEGVNALLDAELPYESDEADENGVLVQPEKTISSEIIIDNPYGSDELRESLVEFSEFDNPDEGETWSNEWRKDRYQPVWEKGLTLSYWIKVPSEEDENGNKVYKPGSVLRWDLDHQLYYQVDDYGKYLGCAYWDIERQKFADEYYGGSMEEYDKATIANESGVIYTSDYYFEYAETDGTDENGKPIAKLYAGANLTAPVYDHKFVRKTDGYHLSAYFQFNPYYERGFVLLADGKYEELASETHDAYYKTHHTLDIDEGSMVRRAYNDGELQIDVDNSIFWVPDDNQGINLNPNHKASYGSKAGMHNADVFFMNSWAGSTVEGKYGDGAYVGAKTYALSPVTAITTNEEGKRVAIPNGNVDKWHQVTVTLQNDWVEFWVDGEMVDVAEYYSSRGANSLDNKESFKRLNKGTGLRGGWGSEKGAINFTYGNYVARLLMDWITDKEAVLHIGGAGEYAHKYAQSETSCEFSIDDLKFYDQLLTEEQIVKAYEDEVAAMNAPADAKGTPVDISVVTDISVGVAEGTTAVTTKEDKINGKEVDIISIAANEKLSTSTGGQVANPFVGKNLEGATIGYWVKQDDTERLSLLSFMDDEDIEIVSPKDEIGEGKSILYIKNNGEASYIDGYTNSACTKLKNTYVTAADETKTAEIQEGSKEWMYVTATMTNAGIKYYINGELVENAATDKASVRFFDGYFTRLSDEADVQTRMGIFGGTNNQGTRTLMDFLTSENTSIYLGYSVMQGGQSCERTSGCSFAALKYVDAALTDEEVKTLYENSLNQGEAEVKLGDMNDDGQVSLADAQMALRAALHLITLTDAQKAAGDVVKNGAVDMADAKAILRVALHLSSGF